MQLVHDQQRLAGFFLEGHGGDEATVATFLLGVGRDRRERAPRPADTTAAHRNSPAPLRPRRK